jgi:hypothetical protein
MGGNGEHEMVEEQHGDVVAVSATPPAATTRRVPEASNGA